MGRLKTSENFYQTPSEELKSTNFTVCYGFYRVNALNLPGDGEMPVFQADRRPVERSVIGHPGPHLPNALVAAGLLPVFPAVPTVPKAEQPHEILPLGGQVCDRERSR